MVRRLLRTLTAGLLAFVLVPASARPDDAAPPAGQPALAPDPAKTPTKPALEPLTTTASLILIAFKGAEGAKPEITRTKEEAAALAGQVVLEARAKGSSFEALVGKYSDDPGKEKSKGHLSLTQQRAQIKFPQLADALYSMEVGQVSDAVELPMGYAIISREPVFRASHILLMYKGSERAKENVARSKEEAQTQIAELLKRVQAGEDFRKIASDVSDCPSGQRGGDLGEFRSGMMVPAFQSAVEGLKPGETSGVVETPFGFHIIQRPVLIRVRHILLMYKGSERALDSITRSKDEAKKEIEEILKKLQGGADFSDMAKGNSNCPSFEKGGDLGEFSRGAMVPAFDAVAFALKPGEMSGIVETPFGYHIILRLY